MVRKYITRRSIEEFTVPPKLPTHYEDEILEAFANYSLEDDMKTRDIQPFCKDLKIPSVFTVGNKRLRGDEVAVEGTDVVDFDKLLTKSYHLLLFRDNRDLIEDTWRSLLQELDNSSQTTINLADLKKLNDHLKLGISETLLLDMVAVGSEGKGVEVSMTDFAYIMGKLGLFKE